MSSKRPCITIYTDASFCADTGAAGWACWIKTDIGPGRFISGACKSILGSSNEAELSAIANGIHIAAPTNKELLVIVTDCEHAQRVLNGAIRPATLYEARVMKFIRQQLRETGSPMKCNKVKAHNSTDGTRSSLNSECDRLAKAAMRRARLAITQKQEKVS